MIETILMTCLRLAAFGIAVVLIVLLITINSISCLASFTDA